MQDNNSTNQKRWVTTPEDCLFLDKNIIDTSKPHDPLSCALNRAQSVLDLIQADGCDLSHGFTLEHKTVMNALWAFFLKHG
jgi:hypothetical protein